MKILSFFATIMTEYYRISRPIRRTFLPEKCDLNSTCVLCAEVMYYFQTYKYPYIYCITSSISNICEWMKNSWQRVKSETIVKSLKNVALAMH